MPKRRMILSLSFLALTLGSFEVRKGSSAEKSIKVLLLLELIVDPWLAGKQLVSGSKIGQGLGCPRVRNWALARLPLWAGSRDYLVV